MSPKVTLTIWKLYFPLNSTYKEYCVGQHKFLWISYFYL